MKKELDTIPFHDVTDMQGKTYTLLRKELKPVYGKVVRDLLKGYLLLLIIFAVDAFLIKKEIFMAAVAIPVSALLAGYTFAYIHLFIHAAAHYELHPVKLTNDRISDICVGVFFGIPIKNYRKIHWLHHENLGKKNDPEHSYFNELSPLFLLKTITGIHTIGVILSRLKTSGKTGTQKQPRFYIVYSMLFHVIICFLLFIAGGWKLPLIWATGLGVVFPVLATLRQLLEHRDTKAEKKINYAENDHGKINRLFGKNIFDSSFGAAGFNKHLLHHWDPAISYTRLQEVEDFLLQCPETAPIIQESKTSYLKIFIALFKI